MTCLCALSSCLADTRQQQYEQQKKAEETKKQAADDALVAEISMLRAEQAERANEDWKRETLASTLNCQPWALKAIGQALRGDGKTALLTAVRLWVAKAAQHKWKNQIQSSKFSAQMWALRTLGQALLRTKATTVLAAVRVWCLSASQHQRQLRTQQLAVLSVMLSKVRNTVTPAGLCLCSYLCFLRDLVGLFEST